MNKKVLTLLFAINAAIFSMNLTSLPANTFVKVTPITHEFPNGYTGSFAKRFWCNFTWDNDSGRILFYEGYQGSHNQVGGSIYANAIYSFTPADSKVKMLNLSNWSNPSYDHHVADSGTASPHPRHTYGGFKYISKFKSIFMGFGACAHDVTCTSGDIWQYDLTLKTWTEIGKPLPADGQIGESTYNSKFGYLEGSDTLWVFAPRRDASGWLNIYSFNLSTHKWSAKLNYGTSVANLVCIAEDNSRKHILMWTSNNGNKFWYFSPITEKITQLPAPPAELKTSGKIVYVPKHDRYVIYDNSKVWSLNPVDTTWSEIASSGIPGTRFDDYFAYDVLNDAITMFDINGAYWVYRFTPVSSTSEKTGVINNLHFSAFPNPAKNIIDFSSNSKNTVYNIYDISGRIIATLYGSKCKWDAAGIPAGIYTVKAKSGHSEGIRRLTLAK
ncbi:MAG: T9SS type A sorting domain-containing protein [Fibrobacteres bacterium]|nr:T9SS type A sorting domain-containing protein [Fibrobacterota bacterium]